jgi:TrmH family RNA methyltransferase
MIASLTNPKVRTVRRLQNDRRFREAEQAYVIEGIRWLEDALAHGAVPSAVFYTEAWRDNPVLEPLGGRAHLVEPAVMTHMSDLETPPGVLAVLPMRPIPLSSRPTLLLILDAIQTPGNLGTLLRTATAAGVDGVVLAPGCVDAYNPKVVRGAMGAHLRLPLLAAEWPQIGAMTASLRIFLATAAAELPYTAVDWRQRSALIVSNEAHGASAQSQLLGQGIHIPMAEGTESLNAAVAAGIILFEAARQRGFRFPG